MPASRRTFLKVAGGAAAATAGGAALASEGLAASSGSWSKADSPTTKILYDVVDSVNGHVAVGKTGNILHRHPSSGSWEIAYSHGPATRNNGLRAAGVTDDGKRVWYAGSSGALGAFDVNTGMKYNHSAPNGMTSTWEGITVAGNKGSETVYITNGSGQVVKGTTDDKGCISFGSGQKPGSGSKLSAIDFMEANTSRGYAVDTSQNVFSTTDSGSSWSRIGIHNSQVKYFDVIAYQDSNGNPTVYVAAGNGHIYRLDCTCNNWTPIKLSSESFEGIDHVVGGAKTVCGTNGVIYQAPPGGSWSKESSPVSSDLFEISLGGHYGSSSPDVIVGDGGTILER